MLTSFSSSVDKSRFPGTAADPSSPVISRLLTAAVINQRFRELLLTDPAKALSQGFQGEKFALSWEEQNLILSIQADSLGEFASRISRGLAAGRRKGSGAWMPANQPALVMDAE